jgi:hypothetical protein
MADGGQTRPATGPEGVEVVARGLHEHDWSKGAASRRVVSFTAAAE